MEKYDEKWKKNKHINKVSLKTVLFLKAEN